MRLPALLMFGLCWAAAGGAPAPRVWRADFGRALTAEWTISDTEPPSQELARYNVRVEDTSFVRNGTLVLTTKPAASGTYAYAAPRLVSKRTFGLGTLRVTARIPKRLGLRPLVTLRPAAGTPCRYPDDDGHCEGPAPGEAALIETVNAPAQFPFVLRGARAGRRPSDGKEEIVLAGAASPERVPDFWWNEVHRFELIRNLTGLFWLVDDELKQQVTAVDIVEFLVMNGNRPVSYGPTPLAPFDASNALNLVLSMGVGGALSCLNCNGCCPASHSEPIVNSTIGRKPFAELLVYSIEFEEAPGSPSDVAGPDSRLRDALGVLATASGALVVCLAARCLPKRKADLEQRNAEVWLFQKHSDALIYGTSFRENGMNQSFSNWFGTSPYTSNIGTSVPEESQMSRSPSIFRWGAAGMGNALAP